MVKKPGFQVSVGAMAVWVLGAAVYLAMVRGAQGFWMPGAVMTAKPILDVDRVAGVWLLAVATLIGAWIVADAIRLAKAEGSAFGLAMRGAAVVFLAGMALGLATYLKDGRDAVNFTIFERPQWRVKLATLGLTIGSIGILLGLVPARRRRGGKPRTWVTVSVVVAGLAGVLVVAYWREMLIPYLVLIAIEAVSNALHRPSEAADAALLGHPPASVLVDPALWRSLHDRLMTVGLEATAGLFACLLTALWLGRDLRLPAPIRSRWGVGYRVVTAVATWGMGAYLMLTSIGRLHPHLAEGLWLIVSPGWAVAILASFLTLAAGLTARGLGQPAEPLAEVGPMPGRPRWFVWMRRIAVGLARLVVVGLLGMITLAAVARFQDGDSLPWYSPLALSQWLTAIGDPMTISNVNRIFFSPGETPDVFFLLFGVVVASTLAWRFLFARGRATVEAPIDRIGGDRRRVARFLGTWLAMVGVILSLLPAFFLAGMAVLHLSMRATSF